MIISQGYYDLPKRTLRANGNIYHIIKPNILRDVKHFIKKKVAWIWHLTNLNT